MPKRTWSHGDLEEVTVCPACGSTKRTAAEWRRRDNDGLFPDVWQFVQCAACLSLYLASRPTVESIGHAYASYYTHGTGGSTVSTEMGKSLLPLIHGYLRLRFGLRREPAWVAAGSVFALIEPLRLKLDYYGRHLPRKPGAVFDVGCGNGDFLLRAQQMGWHVGGCDPDPVAVEAANRLGLNAVCGFPEDVLRPDAEWDVITLGHVIEHVAHPLDLLRLCHGALKGGGRLWLATPNAQAVGLKYLGKCWIHLHPPNHFCILHPDALRSLLERAGFSRVRFMRRGLQSPAQWRIAREICTREGCEIPPAKLHLARWLSDIRATFTTDVAEEIVVIADKPCA